MSCEASVWTGYCSGKTAHIPGVQRRAPRPVVNVITQGRHLDQLGASGYVRCVFRPLRAWSLAKITVVPPHASRMPNWAAHVPLSIISWAHRTSSVVLAHSIINSAQAWPPRVHTLRSSILACAVLNRAAHVCVCSHTCL